MTQDTILEYAIQQFHNEYTSSLELLADKLNDAGISHYSSGCGVKKVTFDIFPASYYVHSLIGLVSLERNYKTKSDAGLKDSSSLGEYNPAHQFMQYLQRWSGFADEVMRLEGASSRGVAAAQAKLLMVELGQKLATKPATKATRLGAKLAAVSRDMDFYELMRKIGLALESRKQKTSEHHTVNANQRMQQNYQKAMQAASTSSRQFEAVEEAA